LLDRRFFVSLGDHGWTMMIRPAFFCADGGGEVIVRDAGEALVDSTKRIQNVYGTAFPATAGSL